MNDKDLTRSVMAYAGGAVLIRVGLLDDVISAIEGLGGFAPDALSELAFKVAEVQPDRYAN
jgi:hypothetical protein